MSKLQLYVYGPYESGYLDLPDAASLDMEELADAFDEDLSTGDFSLPIDVDWTENNRRLLGFAERIENFSNRPNWFVVDVKDSGWPEIQRGKLTLLEKAGKMNFKKGKFSASVSGIKGLFGSAIKNKKLTDLELGGKITWSGSDDSRTFAEDVMKGEYPGIDYISFVPVAFEEFIDEGRADYDDEFLARNTVNTVIITGGSDPDGWTFGRPKSLQPTIAAPSGDPEYLDYRTIPFFHIQYVIKKCFEEFGYSVAGDFVNDTDFADLLLFNNYAIEQYNRSSASDFNNSINPANHVPDMLIADFLKSIMQWIGLFPRFNGNEVQLVYQKSNLKNRNIASLNHVVASDFESVFTDGEVKRGYRIAYQFDSNDSYPGDAIKELDNKELVATVTKRFVLGTLDIDRPLTTNDIAFVVAENMYYVVADASGSPVLWEPYAEALDEYIAGDGEETVDLAISTLCQYVELNNTTGLRELKNYLGCRQKGSYTTYRGNQVKADFGLRVFYGSRRSFDPDDVSFPMSYNHCTDADNAVAATYSLALTGLRGIAENFLKPWMEVKQNNELVKIDIYSTAKEMELLRNNNIIEIGGVLFLRNKTERSIPLKKTTKLWLLPL
jgi:hypothetical protein